MKPVLLLRYVGFSCPAAFRRLCVETNLRRMPKLVLLNQPPLGGCVLKQGIWSDNHGLILPAAFRRLCVETFAKPKDCKVTDQPPLGGCVLKLLSTSNYFKLNLQPPLGGCVLKPIFWVITAFFVGPAAFRRLCVETLHRLNLLPNSRPSRL